MTFFVDANVILYSATEGSPYREPCIALLERTVGGDADGRTSPAALEEVWHLELSRRAGAVAGLTERAYEIFTPLLAVTDDAFHRALELDAPRLGANDRLHAGTCLAHGIRTIVTADEGFDGIRGLRRVDPLDERALRRLR